MRRLDGVALFSPGPIEVAFVEFGDVTVLVGRNDSGKTRILRLIESAIRDPAKLQYGVGLERGFGTEFDENVHLFGVASDAEIAACLHADHHADAIMNATVDVSLRAELEHSTEPGFARIAICPFRVRDRWMVRGWRVGRSFAELNEELKLRVQSASQAVTDGLEGMNVALLKQWRDDEHIPLAIEALGLGDPSILPEVIAVPAPTAVVEREVVGAVSSLSRALRRVASEWQILGQKVDAVTGETFLTWPPSFGDPDLEDESPGWLVGENETEIWTHPAAFRACDVLNRVLVPLIPDFIHSEYVLLVHMNWITDILAGKAPKITLRRIDSSTEHPYEGTLDLSLDEVASGFVVWLQLAIREAARRVRDLATFLAQATLLLTSGDNRDFGPEADKSARDRELEQSRERLESVLAFILEPHAAADTDGVAPPLPVAWRENSPARLYLIDEPEQRLHPYLQRRASRWLAELMQGWGAQCVLATHAVAFMDIPGDVRLHQLVRSGYRGVIEPLDLKALTPQAQFAHEMGIDRGELLTRWRALLFVEGLSDLAVLEELCADRLERSKILPIPVHGHRTYTGIVEMEIVGRALGTPSAVLLDKIATGAVHELRKAEPRKLHEAMRRDDEIGTVARIIDLEHRQEQAFEILTIGVPDIFDLLDEAIIGREARRRRGYAPFPGHEAAREAFEHSSNTSRNAKAYKEFLRTTYGVSTAEKAIRRVAQEMHAQGIRLPAALDNVLFQVEQLALTAEGVR